MPLLKAKTIKCTSRCQDVLQTGRIDSEVILECLQILCIESAIFCNQQLNHEFYLLSYFEWSIPSINTLVNITNYQNRTVVDPIDSNTHLIKHKPVSRKLPTAEDEVILVHYSLKVYKKIIHVCRQKIMRRL